MISEKDLFIQDPNNVANAGSVEIVERETFVGIEPVVLDVEPVIFLLVRQNEAYVVLVGVALSQDTKMNVVALQRSVRFPKEVGVEPKVVGLTIYNPGSQVMIKIGMGRD